MRITFLGHVGLFVETRGGSVLCDPWFTPAYFGSWFPFPRNDRLDPRPVLRSRLPVHLPPPPRSLRSRVARRARRQAGPGAPPRVRDRSARTRARARSASTTSCVLGTASRRPRRARRDDLAMTSPADGPLGDSRHRARRRHRPASSTRTTRVPATSTSSARSGPSTRRSCSSPGAIWYPIVYDFPAE